MYIDAPHTASKGATFTVQVSGIPQEAAKIRLDKDGFLGETKDVNSSWRSFGVHHNFPGRISLVAVALNKFGDRLDSASTSITIEDRQAPSPFEADTPAATNPQLIAARPIAGQAWILEACGLSDAASVTIEFYGANGGIFRIFPRGRSDMQMHLTPQAAGDTAIIMSCRDADFRTTAIVTGTINVAPATGTAGVMAAPAALLDEARQMPAPLGAEKPPYILPHDTFDGQASAPPHAAYPGAVRPEEVARDMQARTDDLLNRLRKR